MRVVLSILFGAACGSEAPEPVAHVAVPEPVAAPAARRPASMDGAWALVPSEQRLRELKIIAAVTSEDPHERDRLGDLTPQEQALADAWVDRPQQDVEEKRIEWRALHTAKVTFSGTEVTVERRGDEAPVQVPYEVLSDGPAAITVAFDAGEGVQTHAIDFASDVRGMDTITLADGRTFDPVAVRRAEP